MLPNTLIIGVQKSATTWLKARLASHPEVFVPRNDEIHFFDDNKNYARGRKWYEKHFAAAGSKPIRCDKTPAYIWTTCSGAPNQPEDKPERIHALLPDAKLIVVLRDPVKRAISAWNHNVRTGAIGPGYDIEKIFEKSHEDLILRLGILSRGLYHAQLSRFMEIFSRDQLLVLYQERDIIEAPKEGLERVCEFLGIDQGFSFDRLNERENQLTATNVGVSLLRRTPSRMGRRLVSNLDRRILSRLPVSKLEYPKPSRELTERLRGYYQDDAAKLADEFGPVPDAWSVPILRDKNHGDQSKRSALAAENNCT